MNRFVLDASVALAWFVNNPVPPYALRVRQLLLDGARALVPALWQLEMANGLAVAERRRILAPPDVRPFPHPSRTIARAGHRKLR